MKGARIGHSIDFDRFEYQQIGGMRRGAQVRKGREGKGREGAHVYEWS